MMGSTLGRVTSLGCDSSCASRLTWSRVLILLSVCVLITTASLLLMLGW